MDLIGSQIISAAETTSVICCVVLIALIASLLFPYPRTSRAGGLILAGFVFVGLSAMAFISIMNVNFGL